MRVRASSQSELGNSERQKFPSSPYNPHQPPWLLQLTVEFFSPNELLRIR